MEMIPAFEGRTAIYAFVVVMLLIGAGIAWYLSRKE